MELILYTGEIYTLKRDFGKEEVEVYQGSSESIQQSSVSILSCKHDKDKKDNLSAFYLINPVISILVMLEKSKR